ncbi:MAG: hypothetical protein MUF16_01580 [Burkholderiaceae bacterium]|jgi:hypothetical protein|nr:hypothetical protein [Burkholderiaceae bacterium]
MITAKITNEGAADGAQVLAVTVVTVGKLDAVEVRHELAAQESVTVYVSEGQFVMVDESSKED